MCLTLKDNSKLTKQEAIEFHKKINKSTITVYKLLNEKDDGSYKTPHRDYPIELNTHYYNEGKNKFTFFKSMNVLGVYQGLHAFTSLKKAKSNCRAGRVVVKCIIPKGSEYFINKNKHEICSDNLIITDQIVYSNSIMK